MVEESAEFGPNKIPSKEFLRMIVANTFETGFLHPDRLQTFVASFSAVEDQLSQWRGYSHGTCGVSLGFQLSSLRKHKSLACFAPCVYQPSRKRDLIRQALHHYFGKIQGYWNAIEEEGPKLPTDPNLLGEIVDSSQSTEALRAQLESATIRMYADLLRLTALLKNESFSEEQEWRLVIPVLLGRENTQNRHFFRAGNTTLIPCIAHPFSAEPGTPIPLIDLILGPGSHPNAVQATQSFLKSEVIDVAPRESKVPYRPW